ncbi:glycoside hydrolase superfamily [Cercophora newfieldiana]|uniref:Glycoside hydrolase superfamily n=1 Tax=Cercophora newfieldiana TaxID=92897 RepID=A0AA39YCC1_9PEZI|nr:glycoside hydrolase superfamily [Cercophora newfieldiana]
MFALLTFIAVGNAIAIAPVARRDTPASGPRERLSLNSGWRFKRWTTSPDDVSYSKLKSWVLPSANDFIKDTAKQFRRPSSEPANVTFTQPDFDDKSWEQVDVPHDWAVKGPFYSGANAVVGGGMGRLPIQGVAWYRRSVSIEAADAGKSVFLDIDGAMSYAMVWLNGRFVGGWPYGYASFRLDLTPYARVGSNQLAIRLDNAVDSSRFYPGAGIYRNVWLTKVSPQHVAYDGTWITTKSVSGQSAALDMTTTVENAALAGNTSEIEVSTDIYVWDSASGESSTKVGQFSTARISLSPGSKQTVNSTATVQNPRLWGPKPSQQPNLYVAVTRLRIGEQVVDEYRTRFGIRTVQYAADGIKVNGQRVYIQGVNQHHDLGSLGAAFNVRAAERQLEMLQDMGCNAVRTSHNPPSRELLDIADELGILMLDEIFDTWNSRKVRNDFHLIFPDWYEADLRSFIRRDRNHPSVVVWSFGNEVAEQRGGNGDATARRLRDIVREEDPTRQTTVGMNNAGPNDAFTGVVDIIGLNYQGEGRGSGAATFPDFRAKFPSKMIFSTESSSGISTRGTYIFPVSGASSVTVSDSQGGDPRNRYVSAYELYAVSWGASPDKVFAAQDRYPYVAGEYVWTGWDYIGEPTPYDLSRSSYFGIIDLAGFPKDRFYLYQARWNPTVRMAHILPHWNWPNRTGETTPVHVFSAADQAELFLNGVSQGVQKKAQYTYRFRWDKVVYQPGELRVVTYKGGSPWANATVRTTGEASQLRAATYRDRQSIKADGSDLSFVSISVCDQKGDVVPQSATTVSFSVQGPGEIVTTDNGDPTDMVPFPSPERKAFGGLALAIVRAKKGSTGKITVTATAKGLQPAEVVLEIANNVT